MRRLYRIFIILSITVSIISCRKVIDLELPDTDPKIVVNSFFTDKSQIKVHLSESLGILENNFPECMDAIVIVKKNNIVIDTMYYEDGYYYSHVQAEKNCHYALEITAPGMEAVQCGDIIPEKTVLEGYVCADSIYIDGDGFIINELKLDFQDPAGPSFYEVELEAKDLKHNYRTGLWFMKNSDPVITSTGLLDYRPRTIIFPDDKFDGNHCSVKIYFATRTDFDYDLRIIFRSVSEVYYRYKEKQFAYLFSLESDIFSGMGEPINLYSNITGGYGIFAGFSTDEKVITVR